MFKLNHTSNLAYSKQCNLHEFFRISCFSLGCQYFNLTQFGYFQDRFGTAGEEEFLGESKENIKCNYKMGQQIFVNKVAAHNAFSVGSNK